MRFAALRPVTTLGALVAAYAVVLAVVLACGSDSTPQKANAPAPTGGDGEAEAVTLRWDAVEGESVSEYRIYVATSKSGKGKLLKKVKTSASDFDPDAPTVTIDVADSELLEELLGEKACFKVAAYGGGAESDPSDAECVTL